MTMSNSLLCFENFLVSISLPHMWHINNCLSTRPLSYSPFLAQSVKIKKKIVQKLWLQYYQIDCHICGKDIKTANATLNVNHLDPGDLWLYLVTISRCSSRMLQSSASFRSSTRSAPSPRRNPANLSAVSWTGSSAQCALVYFGHSFSPFLALK